MATTYTGNAALGYPAKNDRNYDTVINATVASLDAAAAVGSLAVTVPDSERPTSASLNVKVAAGPYRKADGTVATYAGTSTFGLTASSTNYVYLTDSGTLTKSTSGFPAAGAGNDFVPLATVATGPATVTGITDSRVAWKSAGSGITSGNTYTQAYSTAARTVNAYTSSPQSSAYTGQDNTQSGSVYARLTDLNAVRAAYETLRASHDNLLQVVTAIIDDLQSKKIVG